MSSRVRHDDVDSEKSKMIEFRKSPMTSRYTERVNFYQSCRFTCETFTDRDSLDATRAF